MESAVGDDETDGIAQIVNRGHLATKRKFGNLRELRKLADEWKIPQDEKVIEKMFAGLVERIIQSQR